MSGHCKSPSHLRVIVEAATSNDAGPGDTLADYVAQLGCPNAGNYNGWGVELVPLDRHGQPVTRHAMRLLPAAAEWLPDQLDNAAGEANADHESVALQHTFAGIFRVYRTFTPAGAQDLAARIRTAAAQAGAEPSQGSPSAGR